MIALTGGEEASLRRLQKALDVPPPLATLVRVAVAEYIVARLRSDPKVRQRYNAQLEIDRPLKLEP